MKKILLPTDFSENSRASAVFAAQLSKITQARLYLVHVRDIIASAGLYKSSNDLAQEKLHSEFAELTSFLESKTGPELRYETLLLSGSTTNAIASIADEYDLIVMSSKGEADLDRLFLGSTTKYMVEHTQSSILVVPPGFAYRPIKKIIWALDDNFIPTSGFFHPLPEIARQFDAKIEIFHQDRGRQDKGLKVDLDIFLEDLNYSIHYSFDDEQILDSILDFSRTEAADLICMIHHQRSAFMKLFNPSKTLASISRTRIPLLILPYQNASED